MIINENNILNGLLANNRNVQKQLYDAYYPMLYRVAFRYLDHAEDIQEVLNDSFLELFLSPEKFKGQSKISTYLTKIVIFKSIKKYEKKLGDSNFNQDISSALILHIEESDTFDQIEFSDSILQCLKKLPDIEKIVLNLSIIEEYSHKEIGEILKIKESTSRYYLFTAKTLLKNHIKSISNQDLYKKVIMIILFISSLG